MKLKSVKLANSIKVGSRQESYLSNENTQYPLEIALDMPLIKVTDKKTGGITYTSIFNTIFFVADDEQLQGTTGSEDGGGTGGAASTPSRSRSRSN